MKTIFCILTVFLLASACGAGKGESRSLAVSFGHNKGDTTLNPLAKLDSLDRTHNKSVKGAGHLITKAHVNLTDGDSTINLVANIRRDHRIFGYAQPDLKSERLLLLSVFTSDVKNNPFACKLGAYYDTRGMDGMRLKYLGIQGEFIKALAIDTSNMKTILYFEKKWVELE